MSGGSQHNPNGRQSQLGAGWSPLQLQVANLLARAPQAHMASERGVTWHTPTPPPHLYHVPAPSPPDPLQAMKSGANSVFRHTATPPELYRHTPTPPDKHLLRHTPSPGDVKAGAALPPAELYPHLGPGRDKLMRADELLAYARGGVDLTVGGPRGTNGSPAPLHPTPGAPALSVRDAPTINSLIARAAPHSRPPHTRVDALLERLSAAPAPASPHSVIVHSRAAPTPSPPSSNEDSADSCGAPPGSKRKRKPERTIRVPVPAPPPPQPPADVLLPPPTQLPLENGDLSHMPNGPDKPEKQEKPEKPPTPQPQPPEPHARRKTRSGSAETIDDIAAMIASTESNRTDAAPEPTLEPEPEIPVTVDKLKSVLASPEPETELPEEKPKTPPPDVKPQKTPTKNEEPEAPPATAAAPRRRSARTSNSESTNVPIESPSEAKPAEPEASEASSAEPTAASFVEVENQLEKMFAGIEEPTGTEPDKETEKKQTAKARKRRKSAPTKGEKKASKRQSRASTGDDAHRRKMARKKGVEKKKDPPVKDAYDSGSNASSSRSRGPYIQIVGPRDSPVSVSVVNASANATEEDKRTADEWRNGLRARGLHASTLGLRYDASTPDASWLCAFCERGPHHVGLGDLFGPYRIDVNCEDFRNLDEASKLRFASSSGGAEVWFHEACGVWAPGLLAAGCRLWGLAPAVCGARAAKCASCGKPGAALTCAARACKASTHVPCASTWSLGEDFRALCPRHA
uniref:HM00008 protein n=4 Tax=Heliconius melpomene TaxID=34740 RepID=C9S266_HELME|nr:HM00008 [Heliconius melpomene]